MADYLTPKELGALDAIVRERLMKSVDPYAQRLSDLGLIRKVSGGWKATAAGVAALASGGKI